MEKAIHKILHVLEIVIAVVTLLVLLYSLGLEVFRMITVEGYLATPENYLHSVLTIVVGLEFVRMLMHMTPANTLEVLIAVSYTHLRAHET